MEMPNQGLDRWRQSSAKSLTLASGMRREISTVFRPVYPIAFAFSAFFVKPNDDQPAGLKCFMNLNSGGDEGEPFAMAFFPDVHFQNVNFRTNFPPGGVSALSARKFRNRPSRETGCELMNWSARGLFRLTKRRLPLFQADARLLNRVRHFLSRFQAKIAG
jgi:hypothetical protein